MKKNETELYTVITNWNNEVVAFYEGEQYTKATKFIESLVRQKLVADGKITLNTDFKHWTDCNIDTYTMYKEAYFIELLTKQQLTEKKTIVDKWAFKKESLAKACDMVLYHNNNWHTIFNSQTIDLTSVINHLNILMQQNESKVVIEGSEFITKEMLQRVNKNTLINMCDNLKNIFKL